MKKPFVIGLIAIVTNTILLSIEEDSHYYIDNNKDNQLTNVEPEACNSRSFGANREITVLNSSEQETLGKLSKKKHTASQQISLPGYNIINDINYADDQNPRHTLLLVIPDQPSNQPLPLLVFIHGGGWKNGEKKSGLKKLAPLLDGAIAGASINYRLSEEAQWPAQIHDCKAAIRWLRAHAKEYNIDPEKIGVYGNSAGGHLALMLGVSSSSLQHEGKIGEHTDQSSSVRCVIDGFGPTNLLTMGKTSKMNHDAPRSAESLLVGGPLQESKEIARFASPLVYVNPQSSPTLILHGDRDPIVPFEQSYSMAEELKKNGVICFLVKVEGAEHGFPVNGVLRERMSQFLTRYLLDGEALDPSEEPVRIVRPERFGQNRGARAYKSPRVRN